MIFKKFPIKDFFLKILILFVVISSFKIIESYISTKNLCPENAPSKNNWLAQDCNFTNSDFLPKDNAYSQQAIPKAEVDTYQLVQKLDARIEEQAHLLSNTEKQGPNFYRQLYKIKLSLEKIKIEASKRNIQNLIDHPLISEIENKLITYKQTLVASN